MPQHESGTANVAGGVEELLPSAFRERLVEAYRLDGPRPPDRPWIGPAYGLGLMIDAETGIMGHTGVGRDSTAAVYFAPRRTPPRAVAAFANTEDQRVVEKRAVMLLTGA